MEDILKTLISIPSVTQDNTAINPAIEYIDRFLSEQGMYVRRFDFNGVESVVATTQRTKKPRVLLSAHVDVAAAPPDQFKLTEKEDRYWGRGCADMKCAIAAYMQLAKDLSGSLDDYDFGIMITGDEEHGGSNGVRALVEDEGYSADIVIVPDGGDSPDGWKLERNAKGKLALKISTTGKAAHSSRPWKGDNAIDKLMVLLDKIKQLFPDQGPATNTLAVKSIHGGGVSTQIPDSASAELDIRTLTDTDNDRLILEIGTLCRQASAELNVDIYCNSGHTDLSDPLVKQFIGHMTQVIGSTPAIIDSTATTDARFFAKIGIPYAVISPPCNGYHGPDEWVSKDGLEQLLRILHLLMESTAAVKPRRVQLSQPLT